MAKTPIEILFDNLEWKSTEFTTTGTPPENGGLYATHSGVLEFGGLKLRCHRLNNGEAVIDADDFKMIWEELISGEEDQ